MNSGTTNIGFSSPSPSFSKLYHFMVVLCLVFGGGKTCGTLLNIMCCFKAVFLQKMCHRAKKGENLTVQGPGCMWDVTNDQWHQVIIQNHNNYINNIPFLFSSNWDVSKATLKVHCWCNHCGFVYGGNLANPGSPGKWPQNGCVCVVICICSVFPTMWLLHWYNFSRRQVVRSFPGSV